MTSVLVTRREETGTDTQGEEHVMVDAKIEVMHLQVKECKGLLPTLEARRKAFNTFILPPPLLLKGSK